MVELIEYVIVFGISAGVAGASVMLVHGALPGLDLAGATSKSDQIGGAARLAVVEGRDVTLLLPLKSASVSCSGGALTVSLSSHPRVYPIDFPCTFSFQGLDGLCTLLFSATGNALGLKVTC